jgi:hypothetical protein
MVNKIFGYFRRLKKKFHKHYFIQVGHVSHLQHKHPSILNSTYVVTGKIMCCSCGLENRSLTGAGLYQLMLQENYYELIGEKCCGYSCISYYTDAYVKVVKRVKG